MIVDNLFYNNWLYSSEVGLIFKSVMCLCDNTAWIDYQSMFFMFNKNLNLQSLSRDVNLHVLFYFSSNLVHGPDKDLIECWDDGQK